MFNRPIDHVDFPIASRETGFIYAGISGKPVNFLKFLLIEHLPDGCFVFLQSVDIRCHVRVQVRRNGSFAAGNGAAMGVTEAAECCCWKVCLTLIWRCGRCLRVSCSPLFCDLSLRAIWPELAFLRAEILKKQKLQYKTKYLQTMATA